MLFQEKNKKIIRIIGAIVSVLVIISMILMSTPIFF